MDGLFTSWNDEQTSAFYSIYSDFRIQGSFLVQYSFAVWSHRKWWCPYSHLTRTLTEEKQRWDATAKQRCYLSDLEEIKIVLVARLHKPESSYDYG